jgi:hypothetical protein
LLLLLLLLWKAADLCCVLRAQSAVLRRWCFNVVC